MRHLAKSVIGYLKEQLGLNGDFMVEYKRLSQQEKDELRQAAIEEMEVLGIEVAS